MPDPKGFSLTELLKLVGDAVQARSKRREKVDVEMIQARFNKLRDAQRTFQQQLFRLERGLDGFLSSNTISAEGSRQCVLDLRELINDVNQVRLEGREERQELYQWAKALSHGGDFWIDTVTVTVSDEELAMIRVFAAGVVEYFGGIERYAHDFHHALRRLDGMVRSLERDPSVREDFDRAREDLVRYRESFDDAWMHCIAAFTSLNSKLRFDLVIE